jgi:hypothetical protein
MVKFFEVLHAWVGAAKFSIIQSNNRPCPIVFFYGSLDSINKYNQNLVAQNFQPCIIKHIEAHNLVSKMKNTYTISYYLQGKQGSVTLQAQSEDEACHQVKAMRKGCRIFHVMNYNLY